MIIERNDSDHECKIDGGHDTFRNVYHTDVFIYLMTNNIVEITLRKKKFCATLRDDIILATFYYRTSKYLEILFIEMNITLIGVQGNIIHKINIYESINASEFTDE